MATVRPVEISTQDGITVVALGPAYETLDESGLDEIKCLILDVTQQAEPPLVLLDLSYTKFFGSAFIEVLFRAWNRLNERDGGKFAVSGLTEYCMEVIQITHLDRLWNFYPTREEAVRALCQPQQPPVT
jgi:anti-anti-sigma factor